MEIKLGDKVKCKITGFVGIATAKTEFLNGCIQWSVVPRCNKKNEIREEIAVDEQSLKVLKSRTKEVKKEAEESNGGAMRKGMRLRGY